MTRDLTKNEKILTSFLLKKLNLVTVLPDRVEQLDDGGMGTIRFLFDNSSTDRKFQKDLIQVAYKDEDNITVLITLTLDNFNNLFELDFWKTDFSSLKVYPTPDKVELMQLPTT